MISKPQILETLRTIDDPEMPISIVDLGLVVDIRIQPDSADETSRIEIDLTPTFIGCPALDMIRADVQRRVAADCGVSPNNVTVNYLMSPRWTADRISEAGRARLKKFGVTVPENCGNASVHSAAADDTVEQIIARSTSMTTVPLTIGGAPASVPCPYCDAANTQMESPFGPTRCRMIYYCPACKNSFEHLKAI
ncbi:MAG: 1,2-phenylacetyl-CoA epoxidase subunit PaaD [Phycisphaerae bacterium]